jgi:AbrB family looped-hinge helix DNA binding protein
MPTINYKGQITIPKKIRKLLNLTPGMQLDIAINQAGEIILKKIIQEKIYPIDRFDYVRGKADIKWRTNDLMQLLRN